jgi:hypothetical protein
MSRFRISPGEGRRVCGRVLLARMPQMRPRAENEHSVLESKDRSQSETRSLSQADRPQVGLYSCQNLGMRPQDTSPHLSCAHKARRGSHVAFRLLDSYFFYHHYTNLSASPRAPDPLAYAGLNKFHEIKVVH